LRSWLAEAGVDQEVEQSTVLAVSEAAANAIEHAYGFDGRRDVVVVARVDEDELHVSVEDEGSWREPAERSDRGRGMPIMEAVMEEVVVERLSRGTVVRMRRPAK
jgi:serine/threonine-protein kinase RsbW